MILPIKFLEFLSNEQRTPKSASQVKQRNPLSHQRQSCH